MIQPKTLSFGRPLLPQVAFSLSSRACWTHRLIRSISVRCSVAVCFRPPVINRIVSSGAASETAHWIARHRSAISRNDAHFCTPSSTACDADKNVDFASIWDVRIALSANRSTRLPYRASCSGESLPLIANTHHNLPADFIERNVLRAVVARSGEPPASSTTAACPKLSSRCPRPGTERSWLSFSTISCKGWAISSPTTIAAA